MNDLISIIIPIYKVEAYLRDCLNSVQKQTYTNFEVLLINDGSPDNSDQICLEFEQKDTRFNYFYKENGGVSSARNLGLEKTVGKWVVFVDSDDTVEENYLKDFIDNFDKDESVLILQDFKRKKNEEIFKRYQGYSDVFIKIPYELDKFINNYKYTQGYLWNKIFNAKIIKFNNIRFDNDLSLCEDEIFYFSYIKYIKGIKVISKDNYIYVDRENSLTKKYPQLEAQLKYINYSNKFLDYLFYNINENDYLNYNSKVKNRNFKYTLYTLILDREYTFSYKLLCLKKFKSEIAGDLKFINQTTLIRKIDFFLFKTNCFKFLIYFKRLRAIF